MPTGAAALKNVSSRALPGAGETPAPQIASRTNRVGQIERKRIDALRWIERNLDPSARQFRGPGAVVGGVEAADQLRLVLLGHQPLDRLPRAIGPLELVLHAQVPQVAPIQGESDRVVAAPEQSAQQPVAQRNRFVPSVDRGREVQIQRFRRKKAVGAIAAVDDVWLVSPRREDKLQRKLALS